MTYSEVIVLSTKWNTFKSYSAATDAFKMLSGWRRKIMNYLMIQLA